MDLHEFEQAKAWVGFTPEDAACLKETGPTLASGLGAVVDSFYAQIFRDPLARAVLVDDRQIARLRRTLHDWLRDLFAGHYGPAYFEKRSEIGRAHVRVGLPQRFMFTAMSVIRQGLSELIAASSLPDQNRRVRSVSRLLDLEMAVMLETYHESNIEKIRTADHIIMQEQIDQVKHMAEIGQLAASLAHEIKNPLAGISGAIQIISREMSPTDPHLEIMREILRQIDRLDSAVKDLLIYARPRAPELRTHDVGKCIQNSLAVLRGDPQLSSLHIDCQGLDRRIRALIDPAQFEQVISNLVLNAAQACDGRGRVAISLSMNDKHVIVGVRDNGKGMSAAVLERALEPFFTTKARGTGLGLSICRRIIEAHAGQVRIESEVSRGTSVSILLPCLLDSTRDGQEGLS